MTTNAEPPVASGPTDGWKLCAGLAALCVVGGFSSPTTFIFAAVFAGYGWYLYNGGRDVSGHMPDGRPRARAWLMWGIVALGGLSLISLFGLAVAVVCGGYSAYLFSGGRDFTRERADGGRRSAVWLWWAFVTLVAVWCLLSGGSVGMSRVSPWACILVAGLSGAYSTYLFRGGRWVIFFV